MVKLTIKLVIVALLANALYQVVPYYYQSWKFSDAMKELATFPGYRATLPQVLDKCEKIAREHELDLKREDFDVKMAGVGGSKVTTIDVSYEVVLKPIPGHPQPHVFAIHAEGDPPRFGALTP
jgi:hypothetical protein